MPVTKCGRTTNQYKNLDLQFENGIDVQEKRSPLQAQAKIVQYEQPILSLFLFHEHFFLNLKKASSEIFYFRHNPKSGQVIITDIAPIIF